VIEFNNLDDEACGFACHCENNLPERWEDDEYVPYQS
jgi:hypothetical protein